MPFEAAELVRYIPGERVARECVGSMFSGVSRTRRVCDAATQIIYLLDLVLRFAKVPLQLRAKEAQDEGWASVL